MRCLAAFLTIALFTTHPLSDAHACGGATPSGSEGDLMFNTSSNVYQYCDGTQWVAMAPGESSSVGGQPDRGLVAHWRLDETTGSVVNDSTGSNNGGYSGGSSSGDSVGGKFGSAMDFSAASGGYIGIPSTSVIDDIFFEGGSVSMWVYPFSPNTGELLYKTSNSGTLPEGYILRFFSGSSNRLLFRFAWDAGRHEWRTDNEITMNQWNHVVVNFDSSEDTNEPEIYINNVLTPIQLWYDIGDEGDAPSDAGLPLDIGYNIDGYMDDVRYYAKQLSAAEVSQIYNATTADAGGVATAPISIASDLVGHWRMDETTGTSVSDSSGEGNTGNMQNGLTAAGGTVSGVARTAIEFDSSGPERIQVPHDSSLSPSGDMTVAFWIKTNEDWDALGGNVWRIMDQHAGAADSSRGWWIEVNGFFGAEMLFRTGNGSADNGYGSTFSNWDVDTWYHIAFVYNQNGTSPTVDIYRNGAFSNTRNAFNTPFTPDFGTDDLILGGGYYNTPFDGALDDVRIYERALSATEILALYNLEEGIRYNSNHGTMEYYDGGNWVSMTDDLSGLSPASCTNPSGDEGDLVYNTSHNVMQFCSPYGWISIGK